MGRTELLHGEWLRRDGRHTQTRAPLRSAWETSQEPKLGVTSRGQLGRLDLPA